MPVDPQSEIAQLAALLCEGELAPTQAARLEELVTASAEARRFLVEYLQLHGELLWEQASGAGTERPAAAGRVEECGRAVRPGARRRLTRSARWAAWAAGVAAVVGLAAGLAVWIRKTPLPQVPAVPVARLAAVAGDQLTCAAGPLAAGSELVAGQEVQLAAGLAEIEFTSGARVILEGPARFALVSRGRLVLHQGRLTARVPAQAAGFTVAASGMVIVDRGTEFGVLVAPDRPLEVHVLAGCVELQPEESFGRADGPSRRLGPGQAVRVIRLAGLAPQYQEIALREDCFVRAMPGPESGSIARLRRTVTSQPGLVHHYPFEGDSVAQRLADHRGGLHLAEVVMAGGDGAGRLQTDCRGFDPTSRAVRFWRGLSHGNAEGIGLQSETPLIPSAEMTLELLLRLDENYRLEGDSVCAAVAVQGDTGGAFLLATVDHAQMALRLEEDSGWQFGRPDPGTLPGQSAFRLIPGDWYYVAATFRAEKGNTVVSVFSANLSRGQRKLHTVLNNRSIPGVVPAGRLGIGKGFREDLAHAFAWPGQLDEVAIYDRALDPATFQQHLDALLGPRAEP